MRDVIVVGAGNAGLVAALSANECGAKVTVLEKAPESLRGGNTCFTLSNRFPYKGVEDILELIPDLSEAEIAEREFPPYSEADFYAGLMDITGGKADSELVDLVVHNAYPTWKWVHQFGVRWLPISSAGTPRASGVLTSGQG